MSQSRFLNFVRPFIWVPSLYVAMGIPFNMINGASATMFKSLGLSDGQITVALGNIIIAWSLKPLWAAFLDMYRTKKFFVLTMEVLCGLLFAGVAMCLPLPGYFQITIALLWVAAFASSTQDICGDGIYLTSLDKAAQGNLAGIQGMAWNIGRVLATGLLISGMELVADGRGWSNQTMWMAVWMSAAALMVLFAAYHVLVLPTGSVEHRPASARQVWDDFLGTAVTFFHKRAFWGMIAFVFLYRLGEGLLLTEGKLFLQSAQGTGGLGLTAGQVSNIDGTWGTLAFIVGSILGGMFIGAFGLKRTLVVLALCLNVPHFTFVYLAHAGAAGHGLDYATVAWLVSIEKFGYGFGFVGNMVYMMQQLAPGRSTMTHYAFATALMNFMLVPTTMVSGPLAEWLGFYSFFVFAMFASVPSVLAAWRAPFPLENGSLDDQGRTPDDPARLSTVEQAVQRFAGQASIYAMLNILTLLIVDAKILGTLQGRAEGSGQIQFGLLLATAVFKGFLTQRAFARAAAAKAAAPAGEAAYLANARGAKIASLICAAVTLAVLWFGARLAF